MKETNKIIIDKYFCAKYLRLLSRIWETLGGSVISESFIIKGSAWGWNISKMTLNFLLLRWFVTLIASGRWKNFSICQHSPLPSSSSMGSLASPTIGTVQCPWHNARPIRGKFPRFTHPVCLQLSKRFLSLSRDYKPTWIVSSSWKKIKNTDAVEV